MSASQRRTETAEQIVVVDAGGYDLDRKIAELYDRQESLRTHSLNGFENALAQLRSLRSVAALRKVQGPTITTQPRRTASKAA